MNTHPGRRWTPASIAFLTTGMIIGFGFMGYCGDTAVKAIASYMENNEKKLDKIYNKLDAFQKDLDCTKIKLASCCAESTKINC